MSRHNDPGAIEEWGDELPPDPLAKFAALHVPAGGFDAPLCRTGGCTFAATVSDEGGLRWCKSCADDIADYKREQAAAREDAVYIARMKKAPYHPIVNPYGINPDEFGGSDYP